MKKTISRLTNLVLFSTLFWGVPAVETDELVLKEAASVSLFCHMQASDIDPNAAARDGYLVDEYSGTVVDFHGSCDDDARGGDEIENSVESHMRSTLGMGSK